jgi:hypothetical protein
MHVLRCLGVLLLCLLSGCASPPAGGPASETGDDPADAVAPIIPIVFTTHIDAPDPDVATGECSVALMLGVVKLVHPEDTPVDGRFGALFDLPRDLSGAPFALEPSTDLQVRWEDDAGNYVGGTSTSGAVPDGATQAHVCGTGPGATDIDVTLTITPLA